MEGLHLMNKFEEKAQLTKDSLIQAFWELVWEKGFQKIKIKDVTDRAGVYRSTFYLHFTDIYDLLEKEEDSLIEIWKTKTEGFSDISSPYELLKNFSEYYNENGEKIFTLLNNKITSQYESKMKQYIYNRFLLIYKEYDTTGFDYIFEFYISAIIGALTKWYSDGKVVPIDNIIKQMMHLIEAGIQLSLSSSIKC